MEFYMNYSHDDLVLLQTGIWTELYKIEDMFLKPLRVGVNMSRAHYERELHTTDTKKSRAKGQTGVSSAFS